MSTLNIPTELYIQSAFALFVALAAAYFAHRRTRIAGQRAKQQEFIRFSLGEIKKWEALAGEKRSPWPPDLPEQTLSQQMVGADLILDSWYDFSALYFFVYFADVLSDTDNTHEERWHACVAMRDLGPAARKELKDAYGRTEHLRNRISYFWTKRIEPILRYYCELWRQDPLWASLCTGLAVSWVGCLILLMHFGGTVQIVGAILVLAGVLLMQMLLIPLAMEVKALIFRERQS